MCNYGAEKWRAGGRNALRFCAKAYFQLRPFEQYCARKQAADQCARRAAVARDAV